MRLGAAVLMLVACGHGGDGDHAAPPPAPVPAPAPRDAGAPRGDAAVAPAPLGGIEAPPGGELARLAVTPAEDAALTVDRADEVRLWPTLDGSRPPVVVALPPARAIALQHAGVDFVACAVVPGGAFDVRLDARGRRLAVHELPALDRVAAVGDGFVAWQGGHPRALDLDGHLGDPVATPPAPPAHRVTIHGSDLAIAGDSGTRYLGYAFPANAAPAGTDAAHLTISAGDGRWLVLDAALQPVRELVPPIAGASSVRWLGGDDWLVDSPAGVSVWTVGTATVSPPLAKASVVDASPETHLVLLAEHHLARYVPDRHALEPIAFTAWGDASTTPQLVSPKLAHGAVLALSLFSRDNAGVEHGSLRWIRDLGHPERGETHWDATGRWPVGVNSGGHAPVNEHGRGWSVVDDQGKEHPIPDEVGVSPDGEHYLVDDRAARTVQLVAPDGAKWTLALPGADPAYEIGVVWLDDSHLMLVGMHGVATVDPKTGAIAHASAGWGFELAATPHAVSTLGRPLVADLAPHPEPPLALAADGAFQKLVHDIAQGIDAHLTGWGPMHLDGAIVRVAWLQAHEDTGTPLFGFVVDVGGGKAVVVDASGSGFPELQGPWPAGDPPWGTLLEGDDVHSTHTMDETALHVATKWIHGSNEHIEFTREHGVFVATSDSWTERENNGHGFDESGDDHSFAPGHRPKLEAMKAHSIAFQVSAPSADAATLAAAIHEIEMESP